jgi:hypothetical protein
MSLSESQKAFIKHNYGGPMTNIKIQETLKINEGEMNRFIHAFTTDELCAEFKYFQKNVERNFYDPLEEPDMTPVESSIRIEGSKTIYTFQSRMNY